MNKVYIVRTYDSDMFGSRTYSGHIRVFESKQRAEEYSRQFCSMCSGAEVTEHLVWKESNREPTLGKGRRKQ